MRRIAIIADDLTGASDTGVQLARRGLHTIVALDPHQPASVPDCDVLVVDTDSRALTGPEAYATVARAVRKVMTAGYQPVYKKLDSTLRGNIGAELDAVMDEGGSRSPRSRPRSQRPAARPQGDNTCCAAYPSRKPRPRAIPEAAFGTQTCFVCLGGNRAEQRR